jgi:hypothetical protein
VAFENIPGDVPVLDVGGKLLALHPFRTQKGEPRFGLSEVLPAKMNGREVVEWMQPFGGVRLVFPTPVECEDALRRLLAACESLKAKPRAERPFDAGA